MKIYFVRHGETDWNKEGRLQGRKDIPLNEYGIEQMEKLGDWFFRDKVEVDVIISSPLNRARKSAEIIAQKSGYDICKIVLEPLLVERSFGKAEGLLWQERLASELTDEELEMESVSKLCDRAKECIAKIIDEYEGDNILLVAHGAIIKAVLVALTKGDISYESNKVKLAQGMVTIVNYENGSVQIKEEKI